MPTHLRVVAEHLASADVGAGLEAVPFNHLGFGFFAHGRASDPDAPYIGVWFDDPYPMYWVQIRANQSVDGPMLACVNCTGVEEVAEAVLAVIPRLLALS